jgi:TfoX/Sxy family transcriptional regulator of competence genes
MGVVRYKKMFGEYMVYVNDKPILLVCDDTIFVKPVPEITERFADVPDVPMDYPYSPEKYPGVKKHYVLDVDDRELLREIVGILEPITSVPKPRKRRTATERS